MYVLVWVVVGLVIVAYVAVRCVIGLVLLVALVLYGLWRLIVSTTKLSFRSCL